MKFNNYVYFSIGTRDMKYIYQ